MKKQGVEKDLKGKQEEYKHNVKNYKILTKKQRRNKELKQNQVQKNEYFLYQTVETNKT